MAFLHFVERRLLLNALAVVLAERAAGVELASAGELQRVGHRAGDRVEADVPLPEEDVPF